MAPDPKMIHVLEQFGGTLNQIADVLGTYYQRLLAAGVDRVTARELCLEVQARLLETSAGDI